MKIEKIKNTTTNRWIQVGTKNFYKALSSNELDFSTCSVDLFCEQFFDPMKHDELLESLTEILDILPKLQFNEFYEEHVDVIFFTLCDLTATRRLAKQKCCDPIFSGFVAKVIRTFGLRKSIEYALTNFRTKNNEFRNVYDHPIFKIEN
jgi:hypothetical protein